MDARSAGHFKGRKIIAGYSFLESQRPRKIVVLRALQLGDMLCAVPALRALRRAAPDAQMTLIGLPWADEFAERFEEYVDRVVHLPGYPGLPERPFDPAAFARMVEACVRERFDLAVQMQGNGTHANNLIAALGAKRTAGFYPAAQQPPDHETFIPYPTDLPETRRLLSLTRHLGAPGTDDLEFPLTDEDVAEALAIIPRHTSRLSSSIPAVGPPVAAGTPADLPRSASRSPPSVTALSSQGLP